MEDAKEPVVWGVFVGEHGSDLDAFNSQNGPFPPKPGTEGYVAIGWAAVGDMRMYKRRYHDFLKNFSLIYSYENNRVLNTQANIVWNFAFEIKDGDYVISPSSHLGVVLVGLFVGDYESEFNNWQSIFPKKRNDLMHMRKVKWIKSYRKDDDAYKKLNKIGQLTLTRPSITTEDLTEIIKSS